MMFLSRDIIRSSSKSGAISATFIRIYSERKDQPRRPGEACADTPCEPCHGWGDRRRGSCQQRHGGYIGTSIIQERKKGVGGGGGGGWHTTLAHSEFGNTVSEIQPAAYENNNRFFYLFTQFTTNRMFTIVVLNIFHRKDALSIYIVFFFGRQREAETRQRERHLI